MKKIHFFFPLLLTLSLAACTDASRAKLGGYGSPHRVEIVSGGRVVRSYLSSGKVQSETQSDGYYFNDARTGELIEVAGPVIITQLSGSSAHALAADTTSAR